MKGICRVPASRALDRGAVCAHVLIFIVHVLYRVLESVFRIYPHALNLERFRSAPPLPLELGIFRLFSSFQ